MVEFAINSTISSSSGFAPFKLNYSYIPSINPGACPEPSSVSGVKYFVNKALQNLIEVHNAIIESRVCQTYNTNHWYAQSDAFETGNLVYVSILDLSLPKGHASELLPKYIGLFKVLDMYPEVSSYLVELPAQLMVCKIHNRFVTGWDTLDHMTQC